MASEAAKTMRLFRRRPTESQDSELEQAKRRVDNVAERVERLRDAETVVTIRVRKGKARPI